MAYTEKVRWSQKQVDFLRENCEKLTDIQISELTGRSLKSIRRKRERMLLKKAQGRIPKSKQLDLEKFVEDRKEASGLASPNGSGQNNSPTV